MSGGGGMDVTEVEREVCVCGREGERGRFWNKPLWCLIHVKHKSNGVSFFSSFFLRIRYCAVSGVE